MPKPEAAGRAACTRTHALSLAEGMAERGRAQAPEPYPMALAVALARGGRVRVPKGMRAVCQKMQEVYARVLKSESEPTSELALVVRSSPLQLAPLDRGIRCLLGLFFWMLDRTKPPGL